ncbi:hypothetical protein BH11MYX3_BH11MYX3_30010 [soil metagenome]
MKLTSSVLVAGSLLGASIARADDEPKFDTPKAKFGEAWMTAMLAPGGSVAAPSKDKPLDYLVSNPYKPCKTLKIGTATDFKALARLKPCVVASYKGISKTPVTGQWMELGADAVETLKSTFGAKYAKQIIAETKDSTIVEGHYSGDGLNMDVYLALDRDNHVHAIWLTQDSFE